MSVQTSLVLLRNEWLSRATAYLAQGDTQRRRTRQELADFFDTLVHAVQNQKPEMLDTLLFRWVNVPKEDRLLGSSDAASTLIQALGEITQKTAHDLLPPHEALEVLLAINPYLFYALEKAARYESDTRVSQVSEELLAIQQKMQDLDESKSKFISVAAHELKTPITLIEGYAAMIGSILKQQNIQAPNLEKLIEGVRIGVKRLREIVDDMIDISLIDNNMLMLTLQPVWLKHIFQLLNDDLRPVVKERKQTLTFRSFDGDDEVFFGDPERLYQAFRNIILNAIKYTPDGGRITVGGRKLPGFVEVTIADTGIGIAPENQKVIFEKFYQVGKAQLHSSGKNKFKGGGPGLGLPIARGIIEAHGGTIWVESPGCDEKTYPGSTFHIMLPLRKEEMDPRMAKLVAKTGPLGKSEEANRENSNA